MVEMAESSSSKMDDNTSSISSKTTDISCLKPKTFRVPSHSESILDVLNKQREKGEYCDVSVLVEHQRFTAHKCVLAANSPYFHSVLSNENDGMYLKQVGVDGFRVLLDFMYTSRLRIDPNNIQSVLSAAKLLQVNAAVSICCRYLETQLKALTKDLRENTTTKHDDAAGINVDPQFNNPNAPPSMPQQQRPSVAPSFTGGSIPPAAAQSNRGYFMKRPERYNGSVAPRSDIYNNSHFQPSKHRRESENSRIDHQRQPNSHGNPPRNTFQTNHHQYPEQRQRFYGHPNPSYPAASERYHDNKTGRGGKRQPSVPHHSVRHKDPQHMRRLDADNGDQRSMWTRDYQPNYANVSTTSPLPKSGELWDRKREENLLLTRHCEREYQPEYKNVSTTPPPPKSADGWDRKREQNLLLSRHSDRQISTKLNSQTPVYFSEINSYERASARPRTLLITRPNVAAGAGRVTVSSQKFS